MTFDYNIDGACSLDSIGRHWAKEVYKNKAFIFRYSAASYATFIHYNPEIILEVHTDDVPLLYGELAAYDISLANVHFIDWSRELAAHKRHQYPFESSIRLVNKYRNSSEYILKLDNDLICKARIALDEGAVHVWKYERPIREGRPVWGEKHICEQTIGTTDFDSYNMGVMGLPPTFWPYHDEFLELCRRMIAVDISGVTNVNSKIYHCCEQVAYNWVWQKNSFPIKETAELFDHHYSLKERCLSAAEFLLKKDSKL